MKDLFGKRPPRPEDLAKIKELTELCAALRKELKDIGKTTEWYKRELLAREEAYNHRFHKDQPKVGTMDLPNVAKMD